MFSSFGYFACTCSNLKGLEGEFPGFATMDSILDHTFLIEVISKTPQGITVEIKADYKGSTELKRLFIQNSSPEKNCSWSTENFKIQEQYLILIQEEQSLKEQVQLSTCYESFINVTNEIIRAQIHNSKSPQLNKFTITEIEDKLGLKIKYSKN